MQQQKQWWKLFIFVVTVTCLSPLAMAEPADRMDKMIESYVKDHEFIGTVLVAKGDKVLLDKGYGSANIEWNIPNTPQTKFRIASLTKQFTAASVLILEERGKLKLGDKISAYLPDTPPAWRDITIFHLLTHSSGIPNFSNLDTFPPIITLAKKPNEVIDLVRALPLDFAPGEKFNYSNTGYIVLGALIEKVSGKSYESFLQENIFTPLAMNDSGYDSSSQVLTRRAAGYTFEDGHFANADYMDMGIPFSAGGLYSTCDDLLRWEKALYGGKLLSAESLKKMTTPYKDDYAFGLVIKTYAGSREFSHNGGINGFSTSLAYRPDDDLYIVVLSNMETHTPDAIAGRLVIEASH